MEHYYSREHIPTNHLLETQQFYEREEEKQMKISQEELTRYPPKTNPFIYDMYHMGIKVGKDHYFMMPNHYNETLKYFIIVNVNTGYRIKFNIA